MNVFTLRYRLTTSHNINTLRPRPNDRHSADDVFKCIFLNEEYWILSHISLKYIPKGHIIDILALVQVMAWRRTGDKTLSESMMFSLLAHMCVIRPQWVMGVEINYTYTDKHQLTFRSVSTWWRHQMENVPRDWPFVRGIHRSPVSSPHKGQWRGALMFSLICAWTNDWVNNRDADDLKRHRAHYDVSVMDNVYDFTDEFPIYNVTTVAFGWVLQQVTIKLRITRRFFHRHGFGRDQMADISQMTFQMRFLEWKYIYELRLIFHSSLFLRI